MSNKVKRIETHKIKSNHQSYQTLVQLSHLSNNLYNQANYIVRQNFTKDNQYLNYYAMYQKFMKDESLKENWNQLPSQCRQQILRLLDQNWKAFFKSVKDYKKNRSKYSGKPKLPKYREKGVQFLLIVAGNEFKLKDDGYIHLAKKYNSLKISTQLKNEKINQIRMIPKLDYFKIEVIYEKEINNNQINSNKIASIDLGLNNLATLTTNFDTKPIIYNGKKLKSINHYYNYQILLAQKELNIKQNRIKLNNKLKRAKTALQMQDLYHNDLEAFNELVNVNQNKNCKLNQYTSKKMKKLWLKRENKINDELHKISKSIIDYCVYHQISTVVIGHNKKQKQSSKLKNFVQLPIFKMIQFISYKAEEFGIRVVEINEAYTSGTSFLDDELPNQNNYDSQRRLRRGLFKSNDGKLINSDVNASYQIMKRFNKNIDIQFSNQIYNPIIYNV